MKKELNYFNVEKAYGFNQDTFKNLIMRGGGCAAVTACDSMIYFKKYFGINSLYPSQTDCITHREYTEFSNIIKPYLHPRLSGIDTLKLYIDGVEKYLGDIKENRLTLHAFEASGHSSDEAKEIVKSQIDSGFPIPYLMLKHNNPLLKDYVWHWFIIGGYEKFQSSMSVKIISYGEWLWFDFDELWNGATGKKGGMVLFDAISN